MACWGSGNVFYRVRKSWEEPSTQIGAFTIFQNALLQAELNPGYKVYDEAGNQMYSDKDQDEEGEADAIKK